MIKSFVIWFLNGTYTYGWGENEQDALNCYLQNWARGVTRVVPADQYHDALPPRAYLPCMANAVWPERPIPLPGQPLYPQGKL